MFSLTLRDTVVANKYIEKYIPLRKECSESEVAIEASLPGIYSKAGILDKAEVYYRQAQSLDPKAAGRINKLAYFLIDNDRNIIEGEELVDKALQSSPDNYNYLHTKGWGLYKQGKYEEALKLLERSWELKPIYDPDIFLHLEAAKKAVEGMKAN